MVLVLVARLTPGTAGRLAPSKATVKLADEVPLLVTLMDWVRVVAATTCTLPNETLTRAVFLGRVGDHLAGARSGHVLATGAHAAGTVQGQHPVREREDVVARVVHHERLQLRHRPIRVDLAQERHRARDVRGC